MTGCPCTHAPPRLGLVGQSWWQSISGGEAIPWHSCSQLWHQLPFSLCCGAPILTAQVVSEASGLLPTLHGHVHLSTA